MHYSQKLIIISLLSIFAGYLSASELIDYVAVLKTHPNALLGGALLFIAAFVSGSVYFKSTSFSFVVSLTVCTLIHFLSIQFNIILVIFSLTILFVGLDIIFKQSTTPK